MFDENKEGNLTDIIGSSDAGVGTTVFRNSYVGGEDFHERPPQVKRTKPIIEHPLLDPFEPQLKAFLELGFDGGIRSLEAEGYKLGDDLLDDKAGECFKDGLFSSFAQTQLAVGLLFIELEKKHRELSKEIKRLRSDRSPELRAAREQLEAVVNRQAILTRLMDGILWVLLPKVWIAKHLAFQSDAIRPDPDELMRVLAIAWGLNQENKREIHLVSDLTSIAQKGDWVRMTLVDTKVRVQY